MPAAEPASLAEGGDVPTEDPQRHKIVQAATEVFREHGLVNARTRQIAAAAGVKEAALFRYFKSKEEIFLASVFEPVEAMVAEILVETDLVQGADDKTRNRIFLSEMSRHLQLVVDLAPLLTVALFSDPQLGRTFYNERLWPLLQRWIGAADTSLKARPSRDVEALTIILTTWGMSYGMAIDSIVTGNDVDVRANARWLSELIHSGMAKPTRGRK